MSKATLRSKIAPGSYLIQINGEAVARVDLTGRRGVDDYPWDWHFIVPLHGGVRPTGVTESLTTAVDAIADRWHRSEKARKAT